MSLSLYLFTLRCGLRIFIFSYAAFIDRVKS